MPHEKIKVNYRWVNNKRKAEKLKKYFMHKHPQYAA